MKFVLLLFFALPVFAESGLEKFLDNYDGEMAKIIGNQDYLDELKVSLRVLKKENRFAPSRVIVAYGPRGLGKIALPLFLHEALQRKDREGKRVYGPGFELFTIDGMRYLPDSQSQFVQKLPIAKYQDDMDILGKKIAKSTHPIILIKNMGHAHPPVRRHLLQLHEDYSNAIIVMTIESSVLFEFEGYYLRTFGLTEGSQEKGLARLKSFHPVLVKDPTSKIALEKFAKRYVRQRVSLGQFREELSKDELKQLIDKVLENGQYDRHGTLALIRAIQVKYRK